MSAPVHLFVPGALDQRTGGYNYDRQIVAGLRDQGRTVHVHNLAGRFPRPDSIAHESIVGAADRCAPGDVIVLDSLCIAAAESVLPALASRGCSCAALVHHPASLEPEQHSLADAEHRVLNAVHGCVVTSAWTGRLLERRFGVAAERILVVTPGVVRKAELAEGCPDRPARLLAVGTVAMRKDYGTLLTAMGQVRDLDWRLDCIGSLDREPESARAALSQVDQAGLGKLVRFLGEVDDDDLNDAYRRSHLFVMSSGFEGFGMVLTEALSYGLPIVAADAGPTREVVPPDCGVLVAAGDPTALGSALRRVLSDRTVYQAMRRAAHDHAAKLTNWNATAIHFEQMLDQLGP